MEKNNQSQLEKIQELRRKAMSILFFNKNTKRVKQRSYHLRLWNWFRKNIIESEIEEFRTNRDYFKINYPKMNISLPRNIGDKNRTKLSATAKLLIENYWDICFGDQLPYKVAKCDDEMIGYTLISQTSNINELIEKLYGWYYPLTQAQANALRDIQYPSLMDVGLEVHLLYGPIEFANHHCNAIFLFDECNMINDTVITRQRNYDVPGQRICVNEVHLRPKLTIGQEIYIKYCNEKSLWFTCTN